MKKIGQRWIFLVNQVGPGVVHQTFRQSSFEPLKLSSRTIRHHNDWTAGWQIPEHAQQCLNWLIFVTNNKGCMGEEVVQASEFIHFQDVRKSYGVDVHVLTPLHKRVE